MTKVEKLLRAEMVFPFSAESGWQLYFLLLHNKPFYVLLPPGTDVKIADDNGNIAISATSQATHDSVLPVESSEPDHSPLSRKPPTTEDYIADPSLCVWSSWNFS